MPVVREHMSRNLLKVEPGEAITEVSQRMVERNLGAVLVFDSGRLAGILTERDLMRAVARGLPGDAVVAEYMTKDPETIEPDDTTQHAAVLMIHGGFRHLPVVERDDVVGISRSATSCELRSKTPHRAASERLMFDRPASRGSRLAQCSQNLDHALGPGVRFHERQAQYGAVVKRGRQA